MPLNPAIRFSPDAVVMPGMKLMGRQAAGTGFLRAAVANRSDGPLWGFSPNGRDSEIFKQLVREIDPQADAQWIPADRTLDLFERIGTVYWPAPGLAEPARARLRKGPSAYSLCGVTHTTATHRVMDGICEMLTAPVMPWDALICTSKSVAETVTTWIESERDYLRWRFGSSLNLMLPQLPVIPLGVHAEDFDFSAVERTSARRKLDIGDDEVVALFLGRLTFHSKAHPYPMYVGLQRATRQTGKKIVLIQCGRSPLPEIETALRDGAAQFCPDVRMMFADGYSAEVRGECWAAADIFISIVDNIQETFGLTPVEAMAAGLPAVITDWDGYKDTVRDGIDGFRIPTFMPPPGHGGDFARLYELNAINYDLYCAFTSMTVSVDLDMLAARLISLVAGKELRRKMGEAGRQRARELFDWNVVYRRYQALWAELAEIRRRAANNEAVQRRLKLAPRNA
ncbi:MAG TPA: glycosyltransferase family 4 protein, partial [Roseiarcus sp.]|nr:glycosyltransferase family 4 protein [Roseiarcus sp.]